MSSPFATLKKRRRFAFVVTCSRMSVLPTLRFCTDWFAITIERPTPAENVSKRPMLKDATSWNSSMIA
jgi:hypothetical protein